LIVEPALIIDECTLPDAVARLASRSPLIRSIVDEYGQPLPWRREPGFASLVYAIVEQQVSLAAARAIYDRLVAVAGALTAERFLELTDTELRSVGFSGRKIEYCRILAEGEISRRLDFRELGRLPDEAVRDRLTALKGIGRWTADVYLLHSLGRPDVWPVGDLALKAAVQEALGLPARPTEGELDAIGCEFVPLRSVAARVFWHRYLVLRGVTDVT
jgi:DNA-3-methyladenine glycosylase II